jgi:hypothetical protein
MKKYSVSFFLLLGLPLLVNAGAKDPETGCEISTAPSVSIPVVNENSVKLDYPHPQ